MKPGFMETIWRVDAKMMKTRRLYALDGNVHRREDLGGEVYSVFIREASPSLCEAINRCYEASQKGIKAASLLKKVGGERCQ